MLSALGLDPGAEVVYRYILEQPNHSIDDVCQVSGLAEPEVRAALDQLVELHLIRPVGPPPGHEILRPVDPSISLSALLARRAIEVSRQQKQLDEAREAVSKIAAAYGGARQDFLPEVGECLYGLDSVRERLTDLAANAKEECLSFLPGGAQRPDTMDASKPLDQLALERGVSLRSIYQDSLRNDGATTHYVHWLASLGGETRTVPTLPMLLVIVDRKTALIPLDPDEPRRGALVLHSQGAVMAMVMLFERVWANGTPWGTPVPKDSRGLTPQDRELLRLLGEGSTDENAARQLGVSLRTVRRLSADLMTRLQARSRFEAGVRAARHGWL